MAEFERTTTITVNCPDCHDDDVVMAGTNRGYQRYRCKACRTYFRADDTAKGRKHTYDAELVGASIRDFLMGLSIKQVAESIADRYDIPQPSKDTIYQWFSDTTDKAKQGLKGTKADTGKVWAVDELFTRIAGVPAYAWITIDKNSRYVLSVVVTLDRDKKSATQALMMALKAAKRPPKKIITDKAKAYPPALDLVLPGVEHKKSQGLSGWVDNQLLERANGTYRQREKIARGFHSVESAQHWFDGFTITYNHFRDHSSLKKKGGRPAKAAGIDVPFKEWADFVRADIKVPASKRKKVIPRGAPRVPIEYILRERAKAEKKKKTRKGKGRVRSPKPVPQEFMPNNRQMRLEPSELDEATLAKLKPAEVRLPQPPKGYQYELAPIKETSKCKPSAPKPELPKLAVTQGGQQHDLMGKTTPSFMRPRPAGSKRH